MRAIIALFMLFIAATAANGDGATSKQVAISAILSTTVTAAGQPIVLPTGHVRLIASMYEIAPGVSLPVHEHPYPRYGYVLAGDLTVTDKQSGAQSTYKAGDFIVEMVDRWHFGQNTGTVPVRLLVIDQVPEAAIGNTVLQR
jgi:quercetin dioxygenase-like cupin family protein